MPFRLLDEKHQKRISTARLSLPVVVFIIGLLITAALANTFHQSEVKYQHDNLTSITREFFKVQNLILNNSILRIQSFTELSSLVHARNNQQKAIVKEIISSTMFTRASLFTYRGKNEADNLPDLDLVQRFQTKNDTLPAVTAKKMRSVYLRRKIKLMLAENLPNTIAASTVDDSSSIHLIWRSNVNRNEFIVFSSTLEEFFKDWPKDQDLTALVRDSQSDVEILVQMSKLQKNMTFTIVTAQIQDMKSKNRFLTYSHHLINTAYGTSIDWYQSSNDNLSFYVTMIIFLGLAISLLTSLFLKFILDQNRRIYKLVISRTEQLELAMNQAQEANQAKTRFLANMSHELRTPLNLILGMIELLQMSNKDKKTSDYLKNMQSASEHLLNLITDLLSMSKEDASDVKIKNAPINIPIFFEEIAFIIGPECRKKNLALQMHISHDIPAQLSGDPVKIRQILLNLLRNSLKYTNSGQLSLNVELVKKSIAEQASVCHLRFEVKDTGVGIPKGKMNLIFDRFFQIEDSKMLAEGGVGLGLSIVKDLVSKMNGNIVVKSELGKGSTFTVELDLECKDEQTWITQYQLVRNNLTRVALICDTEDQDAALSRLLPEKIFLVTSLSPEDIFSSSAIEDFDQYIICCSDANALSVLREKVGDKKITIIASDSNLSAAVQHKNTQLIDKVPVLSSKLFESLDFKPIKKKSALPPEAEELQLKTQKTISILAVDDDAGNRELLKAYLSDPQFKVEFAEDGKEAFLLFVNNKPDLVIADLRMPIMNGFELAEAIKNYETENLKSGIATPIILLTADALENTSNEAKKYAISKFLTKPIRRTKLLNAIHETYNEFYN